MAKKMGTPSFEAMVNFFLQHYNFATKKDINKLMDRIDELEKLIKAIPKPSAKYPHAGAQASSTSEKSASDLVLKTIGAAKKGIIFSDIKKKTGLNDKKLRNIIYRLGKIGKIKTVKRGVYVAA